MRLFKPSRAKVISTTIVSILLIIFFVPFVFQYCQPIPGEFGGGGCGLWQLPSTIYPVPSMHGDVTPVNITFYTLPQILLQGISPETSTMKNAFYPYALYLALFVLLLSYMLSCLVFEVMYKRKQKKKIYTSVSKK